MSGIVNSTGAVSGIVGRVLKTSGVTYTDPDAVGSSPSAKIYPDGTVVGSTANGSYTKYPNGDLVCRHTFSGGTGVGTMDNAVDAIDWVCPVASINTFYVNLEITGSWKHVLYATSDNTVNGATTVQVRNFGSNSAAGTDPTIAASSIGRWK
jgi:hypothetical protein